MIVNELKKENDLKFYNKKTKKSTREQEKNSLKLEISTI
jgi:hypothetical protein